MEPVNGQKRNQLLTEIEVDFSLWWVFKRLGPPDYVERCDARVAWRYDIDTPEPYTALIWLSQDERVEEIVKYTPPFWHGPSLFPETEYSLLNHKCSFRCGHPDELNDLKFLGTRIKLV